MPMKYFIGDQEIVADSEALELALDLVLDPGEETDEERAARLDAGWEILQEDPDLFDRTVRLIAEALEKSTYSATVTPLPRTRPAAHSFGDVAA